MTRLGVLLVFVLVACSGGGAATTTPISTSQAGTASSTTAATTTTLAADDGPRRGFSLSPRAYTEEGFPEFFELAPEGGDLVSRVGDIVEWEEAAGSGLVVVDQLAAEYGYTSLSVTGVFDVDNGTLLRPLDDATRQRYVAAARSYAAAHQPPFLGLGVEIDTQWRTHPDDFDGFVALFADVARAVHEVSPGTQILTAFQLERLSGLQGGLFGGENDESLAAWDLLDRFPDADVIAFTTYPGLVYATPDDVPDDYYSRLTEHTGGRPIAFTEMGWQAAGEYAEWSGTPERQARFVARFRELIDGVDVAFYTWSFLFDQPGAPEPFAWMGLFDGEGAPRPAWAEWLVE